MSWLVVCAPAWPDALPPALLTRALGRWSPRVRTLAPPPQLALAADLGRQADSQARAVCAAIRRQLAQRGAPPPALTFGVGAHAEIAELAARSSAAGALTIVPPGHEAAWLAPQPIGLLRLDAALSARLRQFGLHTIGALTALPPDALEAQFGAAGRLLHARATGQPQPLPPATPAMPRLRLGWRFDGAAVDRRAVDHALQQIARRLAARSAQGGHTVSGLSLTLELADAPQQQGERALAEPSGDPRRLAEILLALARGLDVSCGVERLRVTAALAPLQAVQQELFPQPPARAAQLQALVTRLAPRHAAQLLRAAVASPEAACLERRVAFAPWVQP